MFFFWKKIEMLPRYLGPESSRVCTEKLPLTKIHIWFCVSSLTLFRNGFWSRKWKSICLSTKKILNLEFESFSVLRVFVRNYQKILKWTNFDLLWFKYCKWMIKRPGHVPKNKSFRVGAFSNWVLVTEIQK